MAQRASSLDPAQDHAGRVREVETGLAHPGAKGRARTLSFTHPDKESESAGAKFKLAALDGRGVR